MLEGTDIIATGGLFIANTNQEFINYIEELKNKTFGQEEILERSKQIAQFSNQTNIELLMKLCFNETAGNKLA
jgi:hypothetical protein